MSASDHLTSPWPRHCGRDIVVSLQICPGQAQARPGQIFYVSINLISAEYLQFG